MAVDKNKDDNDNVAYCCNTEMTTMVTNDTIMTLAIVVTGDTYGADLMITMMLMLLLLMIMVTI